MVEIVYKKNFANAEQIEKHFQSSGTQFLKTLEERVSISDYIGKILAKAERWEAWQGGELVGLLAVYCNDEIRIDFITNLSIVEIALRQGIASRLLKNFSAIKKNQQKLEVTKDNDQAISFYKAHGFAVFEENGQFLRMSRN